MTLEKVILFTNLNCSHVFLTTYYAYNTNCDVCLQQVHHNDEQ